MEPSSRAEFTFEGTGIRWIDHYALLGPYDFMDIYEAPDVETAHKISLISRAEGAVSAESWG